MMISRSLKIELALVVAMLILEAGTVCGQAAPISEAWLGELPAYHALCMEGASGSPEDFLGVKDAFLAKLEGVASFGAFSFDSVAVDPQAQRITWTICAPVADSSRVPAGLNAVDFGAVPEVFALCPLGESSLACSEAVVQWIVDHLPDEKKAVMTSAPVRAARVAATPPLDAGARLAVQREVVRTDLDAALSTPDLMNLKVDARVLEELGDSNLHRAPLADPHAGASMASDIARTKTLVAVRIPVDAVEPLTVAFAQTEHTTPSGKEMQ